MTRRALVVALALGAAVVPAAAASAAFEPGAQPASATDTALGDGPATLPAISGNGRFVAFASESPILLGSSPDPAYEHVKGYVRKDLVTGAVEPVAPPMRRRRSDGRIVGGELTGDMSLSFDGRYVVFASTAQLVAGDANVSTRDVYVRDMTKPVSEAGAYELVSALDGSGSAPRYDNLARGSSPGRAGFGISDDGRVAVFQTDGPTNLPTGAADAPAGQVLVRDLDAQTTRLVTRDRADPSPAGTPVDPGSAQPSPPVLSGDGTAVVWHAGHAEQIARFLPGEPAGVVHLLWRDLTAPPETPARQVTGSADPDDPGCDVDQPFTFSTTATGPCYGPFAQGELMQIGDVATTVVLSISDDGDHVGFTSVAQRRPLDRPTNRSGMYVVDMRPGVSRKDGTQLVASAPDSSATDITLGQLSGDAKHALFTSLGRAFDGPRPLGGFPTTDAPTTNVFQIDLAENTVERVTRAADGSDYLGRFDPLTNLFKDPVPTGLASSDAGDAVAFTAQDGNLFVGDVNGQPDVVVARHAFSPGAVDGGGGVPPLAHEAPRPQPPVKPLKPRYPLVGFPRVDRSGVARLTVRAPAAGRLRARATTGRLVVGAASRRLKGAGTVTLRIVPGRAARRALAGGRRLHVGLRLTYKPAQAAAITVRRGYTLKRGSDG